MPNLAPTDDPALLELKGAYGRLMFRFESDNVTLPT